VDVEPGEWSEAIRRHSWAEAAKLIDALPSSERSRPEIKYARARVALKLSDPARAAKLLEGLEKTLPILSPEIARERAEAQLEAGPHAEAARYFALQKGSDDLVRAGIAYERAGQLPQARSALDRAVTLAATRSARKKKSSPSSTEIDARHARARVAEKLGKTDLAASDLRWLATFAPTRSFSGDVDARLAKLAPKRVLSAKQRYERALAMADEGRIEQLDAELALLTNAPGPPPSKAELLHARGWAHYRARSYLKAAELLELASQAGGGMAARDLFYAARARSRAHQDERAIEMYREVARRFRKSSYAEQSRFLAARLLYVMGRWRKAAQAYAVYGGKHAKKGRFLERVRYEQAVSWLAGGQHDKAVKAFGTLAAQSKREHERAHLRELEGVALALSGKKPAAIKVLQGVISELPLSFAALAAATRLAAMGQSLPPVIEPAKNGSARPAVSVQLPAKVKLFSALGLDADAERALQAEEETLRRRHAPRGDEVLCESYARLSEASRRYRVGQRAARWEELNRAPANDTRWMWDCIYPRPYEEIVRSAEKEWGLPRDLAYAVMRQESAFSPSVVSPANAVGLMQLIEPTAQNAAKEIELAFEPLLLSSPAYNIRLGTYYLHKLLGTFGGNVALAAAAYNAGPSAVSRWLESGEELPLDIFVARIPYDETRNYVTRVVGNLARYGYLAGGDEAVPKLSLEIPKGLRAGADAY